MADAMGERALSDSEIVVMSSLIGRSMLARAIHGGTQFDGRRDLYNILGYPPEIHFQDYVEKYRRQDIAGKIVDLPPQDTWRKPPVITDGDEDTTLPAPRSAFLQGVKFLVEKRRLWHYLQRVDRLAGVGRYAVLLIGTRGDSDIKDDLAPNSLSGPGDVIYLSVFSEGSAQITSLQRDPQSERFGLPLLYTLNLGEGLGSVTAHWSRVLHVAEDLLEDEIYGMPRLERVYNRLEDLLKVIGGGSEASWKNMDRGIHADVRDGFADLDEDSGKKLSDEIDEYIHGLRRFIRTQGVDLKPLGSDVVDPTGIFNATIALISAACDIPQRILMGSERGELASSQDQANWAGVIASRQTQHAEPAILRPFLDRLILSGALPKPSSGIYGVQWTSLFELNELEKAKISETYANAIAKVAPAGSADIIVTPDEFREKFLNLSPRRAEQDLLDEEDALNLDDEPEEDSNGNPADQE